MYHIKPSFGGWSRL